MYDEERVASQRVKRQENPPVRLHRHDEELEQDVHLDGAAGREENVFHDVQAACQEVGAAHVPRDRRRRSKRDWLAGPLRGRPLDAPIPRSNA